MKKITASWVAGLLAIGSVPAGAQSIGIGANPQGSLGYAMASAISAAVSKHAALSARPVGFGGSTVFMPRIDGGLLEFGANNVVDTAFARQGKVTYKKPLANIRVVGRLVPFQAGILVRNDSDIKMVEDLKGRAFSTEYSRQRIAQALVGGMIATAGLDWSDFKGVPVTNFARGIQLLVEGKVDGTDGAPGSGQNREANAKVPLRFLSLTDTPATRRILAERLPGARFDIVKPAQRLPTVRAPVTLVGSCPRAAVSRLARRSCSEKLSEASPL